MKKFTLIKEEKEIVNKELTFKDSIDNLMALLEIEFDSDTDAEVKNTDRFMEALSVVIDNEFINREKSILEKAKISVHTRNSEWIEDALWEIEKKKYRNE